ncbi:MAG: HAD family hydrolase [Acidobacteria bacterium]|nr:MAG: HAD family hydrolase [Acidobacteriota bacterium]
MPSCPRVGVVLDVDGTLIDSNDSHAEAWSESFKANGYDIEPGTVRPLMGMGGDKILPKVIGVESDSISGRLVSDHRLAVFMRNHLPLLRPTRGARRLVELLLERGHPIAVASSAGEEEILGLLRVAGVHELIPKEAIVTKDETGRSKPDPDTIAVALERLGCPADSVVMIGDTPYDIEAAARVGLRTIAFRSGGFSEQDLADALAIFDDPQDLVDRYETSPLATSSSG